MFENVFKSSEAAKKAWATRNKNRGNKAVGGQAALDGLLSTRAQANASLVAPKSKGHDKKVAEAAARLLNFDSLKKTKKAELDIFKPVEHDSRAVPGNGFDPKNFKAPPKTGFNILFDESMGHNQNRLPKAVAPARATKSEASVITDPVMAGSLQATLGMR